VQLHHHLDIWKQKTPNKIEQNLHNVFSNIKPPSPNEEFTLNINAMQKFVSCDIQQLVIQHIKEEIEQTEHQLERLNPLDTSLIIHTASQQIHRTLKNKIQPKECRTNLFLVRQILGLRYNSKRTTNKQTQSKHINYTNTTHTNIETEHTTNTSTHTHSTNTNTTQANHKNTDTLQSHHTDTTHTENPHTSLNTYTTHTQTTLNTSPQHRTNTTDTEPTNNTHTTNTYTQQVLHTPSTASIQHHAHTTNTETEQISNTHTTNTYTTHTQTTLNTSPQHCTNTTETEPTNNTHTTNTYTQQVLHTPSTASIQHHAHTTNTETEQINNNTHTQHIHHPDNTHTNKKRKITDISPSTSQEDDQSPIIINSTPNSSDTDIQTSPLAHIDFNDTPAELNLTTSTEPEHNTTPETNTNTHGILHKQITTNKSNWKIHHIPTHITTLIIGDSNLSQWTDIPHDWMVECLPGAKINHIQNILQKHTLPSSLNQLIISIGINNRTDTTANNDKYLRQLHNTTKTLPVDTHFLAPSHTFALPAHQQITLKNLHDTAHRLYRNNYIPPLCHQQTYISKTDIHKIHYTQDTCNLLIQTVTDHLNYMHRTKKHKT